MQCKTKCQMPSLESRWNHLSFLTHVKCQTDTFQVFLQYDFLIVAISLVLISAMAFQNFKNFNLKTILLSVVLAAIGENFRGNFPAWWRTDDVIAVVIGPGAITLGVWAYREANFRVKLNEKKRAWSATENGQKKFIEDQNKNYKIFCEKNTFLIFWNFFGEFIVCLAVTLVQTCL